MPPATAHSPPHLPPHLPPHGAVIKHLGLIDYEPTLQAMQVNNRSRHVGTLAHTNPRDEIWLLEHPPVFTQGLAGKPEHVLEPGSIPVIKVERGGQVTYHGPGQLVAYLLLDTRQLASHGCGVKELVRRIEQSLIDLLAEYGVESYRKVGMPGVYVRQKNADAKIAAVGLRIANHATYHGLALNVDMDLAPFARINPCGYEGLQVTQMRDCGVADKIEAVATKLARHLQHQIYHL